MELNQQQEKSEPYENLRKTCTTTCRYTTYQFHHWLIEKGYIILVSSQLKNDEQTLVANINKRLANWIDQQVKNGKCQNRSQLIEKALAQYKKAQNR